MSYRQTADHTNIYRFKVTATGVHERDGYGRVKGQAFEDVKFIGPYTKRIPFLSWIPSDCDVKVERQQLVAAKGELMVPFLEWRTIETKHFEKEVRDDS